MKKNKLITISILGLLLLIPFMIPAKAAPASYVGVVEEEHWGWTLAQYGNDNVPGIFATLFADDMNDVLVRVFNQSYDSSIDKLWTDWSWDVWSLPQTYWPHTIKSISAENTSALRMADWGIPDMITYSRITSGQGYEMYSYPDGNTYYDEDRIVVNDTAGFSLWNLYGALAFSPYDIMGAEFAPSTGINWTEFVADVNWGMTNFWGGDAVNVTATEEANGYSLAVPALGFLNNSLSISINVSYTSGGVLDTYSFEYGSSPVWLYQLAYYAPDVVSPVIIDSPGNFTIFEGYTGESMSWTATDMYAGNYTITQGVTPVVTTTPWLNGTPVVYNIPDGLLQGTYTFTIDFQDTSLQSTTESIVLTVLIPDSTDPVLTSTPSDITIDIGDITQSFLWTATDANPATYTITRNGTAIVTGAPWVSGTPVNHTIEWFMHFTPGPTTYEITFYDFTGNSVSDSAVFTVNPIPPTSSSSGIPGFEPLIVIGIVAIGSIGLIMLKKKKK